MGNNEVDVFGERFQTCFTRYSEAVQQLKDRQDKNEVDWYVLACCLRINASIKAVRLLVANRLIHDATGSVRALFETVVMMAGADRIEGFTQRLHATFLKDKISLIEILWESGSYARFETVEQLKWRLLDAKKELAIYQEAGFDPYGNNAVHVIAQKVKLDGLKHQYYKLHSLTVHPTLHAIEKYVRKSTSDQHFDMNEYPEADGWQTETFPETTSNFLNVATAILNDRFKMNIPIPTLNDMLNATK